MSLVRKYQKAHDPSVALFWGSGTRALCFVSRVVLDGAGSAFCSCLCCLLFCLAVYFGKDRGVLHSGVPVFISVQYLFLQLVQLGGEMGHQLHRGIEFVLKVADLVLFSFPFVADQRHGSHPREPVKVLVLGRDQVELNRKPAYARGLKKIPEAHFVCILANFPALVHLHLFSYSHLDSSSEVFLF